ncbi:hypothetical protein [Modicisalibacter luteus]
MLDALVKNTGLDTALDAVISIDEKRLFKPTPRHIPWLRKSWEHRRTR